MDYFKRVQEQTPTRFWINNVTKQQARLALDAGAVGCTQNPSYTWKILQGEDRDYAVSLLDKFLRETGDDNEAVVMLQRALVERICEQFMPLYEASGGRYGYVSIQGNPFKEDAETIISCARFNREHFPNIMAKVPVTEEGLKAIRVLLSEGVPINATEVMAVRQAVDFCKVYAETAGRMSNPPRSFYSHIAGIFDEQMRADAENGNIDISDDVLWQAGITVAKKIHQITKAHWPEVGFISGGARGLHHFTEMVGADAAVTINWVGTADSLLEQNPQVIQRFLQPAPHEVIDELCFKLPEFRKAYFIHDIEPAEYEDFGPVVRFRSSFETAWANTLRFAAERRKEIGA